MKTKNERAEALRLGLIEVEHGRYSTYTNYKCRCDKCKEANRVRQMHYRLMAQIRAAAENPEALKTKQWEHGTYRGYREGGCRCDDCRWAEQEVVSRIEPVMPKPKVPHGLDELSARAAATRNESWVRRNLCMPKLHTRPVTPRDSVAMRALLRKDHRSARRTRAHEPIPRRTPGTGMS
jgi:hypothetical protein